MANIIDIQNHNKDKYILKHGKERFLEKNLKQKCENPFEWIYGDEIEFNCYYNENNVKTYYIETIKPCYTREDYYDRDKLTKLEISKEDGEFAIKYGLESYLIWQMFNYSTKKRFLEEYNKRLIQLETEVNEDKRFYEEVHLMRNLLEEWILEGTEDDTLGSIVYTEDNKLFVEKYGDGNWKYWKELTEEEKSNYKELESYYTTYKELFENHYDDLKLYALMYYNVWLHDYYNDAISVIYFATKCNEIVGYKKKLEEDRFSLKSQIALMFYENEALFPHVCEKYANVKLNKYTKKSLLINALERYKNFSIPYVFTIANMTEEQCKLILANKENVRNDYLLLHEKYDSPNVEVYNELEKHDCSVSSFHEKSWQMERKSEISNMYETLFSKWINSKKEQAEIEEQKRLELRRLQEEIRTEKYRFNKRNHHYLDDRIIFHKADHSYSVNDVNLESVTTFVSNCFPKFDMRLHAKQKSEKTGVSFEFIFNKWKEMGIESRNLGTAMHSKIENYYLGNDSEETDAYKLFKIFANKVELKPYRTEWTVYDWEHKIAGTIDFVDYQNGEYIIYDWKRSEKIIENGMPVKINKYGEKGNYPLEHLDNTPYYHYALQLSLYKYILEKNYGMKISDLRLGIFHPSYNKPYVLRMPYLEKEINDIFNLRSEVIF